MADRIVLVGVGAGAENSEDLDGISLLRGVQKLVQRNKQYSKNSKRRFKTQIFWHILQFITIHPTNIQNCSADIF